MENGYRWKNSFHNHLHAADVAQFAYYLLLQGDMRSFLTPLERMSLLIAASVHDFDHPGVNNNFLCASDVSATRSLIGRSGHESSQVVFFKF